MPIRLTTSAALAALIIGSSAACGVDAQVRPQGMFERTLAVSGPVTLDVRTGSGSIEIHGGPANSIRIVGRIRAGRSWFNGEVEERVRRIEAAPPIAQNGDAVRVGPVGDDQLFRNISISYDVTVPMETIVRARTGSGSQTITGLSGPVDASTGSGGLVLRAIQRDVRASTGSGTMEIEDVGNFLGRTGSGQIMASAVAVRSMSVLAAAISTSSRPAKLMSRWRPAPAASTSAAPAGRFVPAPEAARLRPRGARPATGMSKRDPAVSGSISPRIQRLI